MDVRLLQLIIRANLDVFWSRTRSTVKTNRGTVERTLASLTEVGLQGPFYDPGPTPFRDFCGFETAIGVLMDSQKGGKYHASHKQWDSIRKVKSSVASFEKVSNKNPLSQLTLVEAERGFVRRFHYGQSASLWYQRFASGCKKARMGQDVRPNQALKTELWIRVLEFCRERARGARSVQENEAWIMAGAYFAFTYVLSLRGPEGFMFEISLLREHREISNGLVWLPIVGRVKGADAVNTYFLRSVPRIDSGINVRHWRDLLLAVHERAVLYGLSLTMTHSKASLDKVQRLATNATLTKMGYRRSTIHRSIVYGSTYYGGLGLHEFYVEQGIAQIQLLLRHLRADSPQGRLLRICIAWAQLQAGVPWNLLFHPTIPLPHLPFTWLSYFSSTILSVLSLPNRTYPPPNVYGSNTMPTAGPIHHGCYHLPCRLLPYAHRKIQPCSPLPPSYTSIGNRLCGWPLHHDRGVAGNERPDTLLVLMLCTLLLLLVDGYKDPTGCNSGGQPHFLYCLVNPLGSPAYTVHPHRQRSRQRNPKFEITAVEEVLQLPPAALPVDVQQHPDYLCFPSVANISSAPTPPPSRDPEPTATTFEQHLHSLARWDRLLLQHTTLLHDTTWQDIVLRLQDPQTELILSSDGGAKPPSGSFGAVFATHDTILVELGGTAYGDNPSSFRAESYGQLAPLRLLCHLQTYFHIKIRCHLRFLLDNIG